ncbi:hypothetical protein DPEC_G00313640 [Dallia pectoralis]|uniref:Uncharacterized protein n=1 Tax=Dallia pectoralis TaxID=75939 RepID=A0ACC2FBX2_DALPE|nr:hypothetical protein DPEC_G00313640 [Dallia pectoralis]
MSSFAKDKLSLHLRGKLGVFATRLKATDLLQHLPCLTRSDREEIMAKKDFSGNFTALQLLLDYLQMRLDWPDQLINALDNSEHPDLADDLRVEWNKWNQPQPSPPARAGARPNVHPAPPSSPSLPVSDRSAQPVPPPGPTPEATPRLIVAAQPAAPPPASLPPIEFAPPVASPSLVPAAPPPASTSPISAAPPPALAPAVVVAPSPALAPAVSAFQLPASALPVSASQPPASVYPVSASPPPASDSPLSASQPPASAAPVSASPPPASASSVSASQPSASAPGVVVVPSPVSTSAVEAAPPPASLSPVVQNPPVSEPPSSPTPPASVNTPEKRPVQETSPPATNVTVVQQKPVLDSVPNAKKVTEEDQHTLPLQRAQIQQSPPHLRSQQATPQLGSQQSCPGPEDPVCSSMDGEDQFLSKPGVLLSGLVTQNIGSPPVLPGISEESLYSGDSGRLQISGSGPESDSAPVARPGSSSETHLATASSPASVPSEPVTTASSLIRQEYGLTRQTLSPRERPVNKQPSEPLSLSHNMPEENTYDSNSREVLFNVVHVSEDASILNNDGQATCMPGNNVFSVSETPPSVQKHDAAWSPGPNQDQSEDSPGNFVDKALKFRSTALNVSDSGPSEHRPVGAIPPAVGTTVNGSSSRDHRIPQPAVEGAMSKATNEPKQEGVARGLGSYCLVGAALLSVSLFVAWRMKK